jgi:ADP-heptose:LPS heptosyltransferase
MLISLISKAKFIIANDTGPAHIASHLNKKGLVLFGSHTSAKKVSIENLNFKSISVKNLKDLDVETFLSEVKNNLN